MGCSFEDEFACFFVFCLVISSDDWQLNRSGAFCCLLTRTFSDLTQSDITRGH